MDTKNPIFIKLKKLNLSPEDYAVFGSGPMFAHGIKDLGNDLDLIARGKAWEEASKLSSPEKPMYGEGTLVNLHNGEIEIFNKWGPGDWDVDELIDSAEIFDGVRFVTLENVIKWKTILGRDKDKIHIKMIQDHLTK